MLCVTGRGMGLLEEVKKRRRDARCTQKGGEVGLGEVLWEAETRGLVRITGFGRGPLMGTERSNDVTAIYRGGGEKGALGENVAGSQVGRLGYTEGRHLRGV